MIAVFAFCKTSWSGCVDVRPDDFVYLSDIEPSIIQEIRYAQLHNFVGRKIAGYEAPECILTRKAATALQAVQRDLLLQGFSLKVYDCYRPEQAVKDFVRWSMNPRDTKMKGEFYPRLDKNELFDLRYIAVRSAHSRGSTVDVSIVTRPSPPQPQWREGAELKSCFASDRFPDNSIDFGTGYDCLDVLSHTFAGEIGDTARRNRNFLLSMMIKAGFRNYHREWWHYELVDEPYKDKCFDFPITDGK